VIPLLAQSSITLILSLAILCIHHPTFYIFIPHTLISQSPYPRNEADNCPSYHYFQMTIPFVLFYTSFYDSFTVLVVDQLGTLRVGFTLYFLFRAFHRPNHIIPHLYLHITILITHTIHISSLLQQFPLPTSSLRSIQSYSHLNRDGLAPEQKILVPIWIFE
jgi:hypothetical protein